MLSNFTTLEDCGTIQPTEVQKSFIEVAEVPMPLVSHGRTLLRIERCCPRFVLSMRMEM